MLETYSLEELRPLAGHEVVDANGDSVGYIDLVFCDEPTGRAEWMGVWSGVAGKGPRVLVPIRDVDYVEDEVRLPWTKDVIAGAPTYDEEDDTGLFLRDPGVIGISPEKERAAYEHYGVAPLAPRAEGHVDARFRAWPTDVAASPRKL